MRAKLTFTSGPWNGKVVPLLSDVVYFGRGRQAGIRIDDEEISSRHFCISKDQDDVFYIEDLDSRNGTCLNDSKLHKNKKNVLRSGDTIAAGKSQITFETYSQANQSPATFTSGTSEHVSLQDPDSPFKSTLGSASQAGSALPTLVNNQSVDNSTRAEHHSSQTLLRAKADETIQSTIQPEVHLEEAEFTEQTAGIFSRGAAVDPEVTMVGYSQEAAGASDHAPASPNRKQPSKTMLSLYLGLLLCLAFLLLLAKSDGNGGNVKFNHSESIHYKELVLTCPSGWEQQESSSELLQIKHTGSSTSVIILTKQKDAYLFSPLWGSPTQLSHFLQANEVFTQEMAQALKVPSLPLIKHVAEREWYRGIKALDITFVAEANDTFWGQFALCHDTLVFCIAKKTNVAREKSSTEVVDMLSWARTNPPRDFALYPRPILLIAPFDAQERFTDALRALNGISSLVEKGPVLSDSVDVIRHYRLAFAALAASSISPSPSMVERHYLHFKGLLTKRRETLVSMQGTVLLKERIGDFQGALDEANRLYNDARQTDDRSYMEWAWKKMAEIRRKQQEKK